MFERIHSLLKRLEWDQVVLIDGKIVGWCLSCHRPRYDQGAVTSGHGSACELKACLDVLAKAKENEQKESKDVMLTDKLDKLIMHHELERDMSHGDPWSAEHAKWAADLRAMKEQHNETLQAVRLLTEYAQDVYILPVKHDREAAIQAGLAVLAKAEESKSRKPEVQNE